MKKEHGFLFHVLSSIKRVTRYFRNKKMKFHILYHHFEQVHKKESLNSFYQNTSS